MGIRDLVSQDLHRVVSYGSVGIAHRDAGSVRTIGLRPVLLGARQVRALRLVRNRQARAYFAAGVHCHRLPWPLVRDYAARLASRASVLFHRCNGACFLVVFRCLGQTIDFPEIVCLF